MERFWCSRLPDRASWSFSKGISLSFLSNAFSLHSISGISLGQILVTLGLSALHFSYFFWWIWWITLSPLAVLQFGHLNHHDLRIIIKIHCFEDLNRCERFKAESCSLFRTVKRQTDKLLSSNCLEARQTPGAARCTLLVKNSIQY